MVGSGRRGWRGGRDLGGVGVRRHGCVPRVGVVGGRWAQRGAGCLASGLAGHFAGREGPPDGRRQAKRAEARREERPLPRRQVRQDDRRRTIQQEAGVPEHAADERRKADPRDVRVRPQPDHGAGARRDHRRGEEPLQVGAGDDQELADLDNPAGGRLGGGGGVLDVDLLDATGGAGGAEPARLLATRHVGDRRVGPAVDRAGQAVAEEERQRRLAADRQREAVADRPADEDASDNAFRSGRGRRRLPPPPARERLGRKEEEVELTPAADRGAGPAVRADLRRVAGAQAPMGDEERRRAVDQVRPAARVDRPTTVAKLQGARRPVASQSLTVPDARCVAAEAGRDAVRQDAHGDNGGQRGSGSDGLKRGELAHGRDDDPGCHFALAARAVLRTQRLI